MAIEISELVEVTLACPFCGMQPEVFVWEGDQESDLLAKCLNMDCPLYDLEPMAWSRWQIRVVAGPRAAAA